MLTGRSSRRAANPVALFAALAIGAGGASSGGFGQLTFGAPDEAGAGAPVAISLEHAELVALRAQSTAPLSVLPPPRPNRRAGAWVAAIGVASALPGPGGTPMGADRQR